jgi:hypothetical protein
MNHGSAQMIGDESQVETVTIQVITLSMGWTNLVPIFHDNVTFILQPEIHQVTISYIDDIPVKVLLTIYSKADDLVEMIPKNPGIYHFVWEHFQT